MRFHGLRVGVWGLLCVVAGVMVFSGATASADSCPNAVLRTGPSASLPNCRAYELVSPPFKDGGFPFVMPFLDGSHVVLSSLGAFGDVGDDPSADGSSYVAGRGASGWSAVPIDPPAALFENSGLINETLFDVSHDFGKALFFEQPASSNEVDHRFYLRQPDGSAVEVGPTVPLATVAGWTESGGEPHVFYAGGSRDLSHIVFRSNAGSTPIDFLWPGDATVAFESLYEYVGTGNVAPSLIGVDDAGHLISQCGTYLGASYEQGPNRYGAVSASGATVFFTARQGGCAGENRERVKVTGEGPKVGELYARVDGSHTVAISEPSTEDCSACDTAPALQAEEIFQGASEDGSKVIFLTTQPLLNSDGDSAQDLYLYDFDNPAGQKIVQVSGGGRGDVTPGSNAQVQGVTRVSPDGSHVYFVAQGVLTTDPNNLGRVAQAGQDNLYLYERDPRFPSGHTVFVATLSGDDSGDWRSTGGEGVEDTPDGQFLLFPSTNDLTPDAAGSASQLYRYDAQTEELVRISIGEGGFNDNGNSGTSSFIATPSYAANAGTEEVSISDDGSYVFFESTGGLTPRAINDLTGTFLNIYEYHEGHVSLISDGQDRHQLFGSTTVQLVGATPSGSDVFFMTADSLAVQDTDTQKDLYDARVDGGFPSPAAPKSCQGDVCQGALAATPSGQAPGSFTFSGPGNPVLVHRDAKRTVKKKSMKKRHGKPKKRQPKRRRKTGKGR